MEAVKCPVRKGSGIKNRLLYKNGKKVEGEDEPCHGCSGKGWVEIGAEFGYYWAGTPYYPCYPFTQYTVPHGTFTITGSANTAGAFKP